MIWINWNFPETDEPRSFRRQNLIGRREVMKTLVFRKDILSHLHISRDEQLQQWTVWPKTKKVLSWWEHSLLTQTRVLLFVMKFYIENGELFFKWCDTKEILRESVKKVLSLVLVMSVEIKSFEVKCHPFAKYAKIMLAYFVKAKWSKR